MVNWQLRFPGELIPVYAERYNYVLGDLDDGISIRVRSKGEYSHEDFIYVCEWKTKRQKKRYRQNSPEEIRKATQIALGHGPERQRIEALLTLHGVGYPVASVLLHFGHAEPYPILDKRAIWSLEVTQPSAYTFSFWWEYVQICRNLTTKYQIPMRTLDRALWQYSKENQLRSHR